MFVLLSDRCSGPSFTNCLYCGFSDGCPKAFSAMEDEECDDDA